MPFSFKTKWMIENPAWPWIVFITNTILIGMAFVSMIVLGAQQHRLIQEVNDIDHKIVQAIKVNQENVKIVAEKAGVPEEKIVQPKLPVIPIAP